MVVEKTGIVGVTYLIRGRSDLYIALLLLPKPAINDLLEYCFFSPNS
jgi:hypothetical protein